MDRLPFIRMYVLGKRESLVDQGRQIYIDIFIYFNSTLQEAWTYLVGTGLNLEKHH